jgi:hypothetical protein
MSPPRCAAAENARRQNSLFHLQFESVLVFAYLFTLCLILCEFEQKKTEDLMALDRVIRFLQNFSSRIHTVLAQPNDLASWLNMLTQGDVKTVVELRQW